MKDNVTETQNYHAVINVEVIKKKERLEILFLYSVLLRLKNLPWLNFLYSLLTRDQLNPCLREYVQRYGNKEYRGEINDIETLCSNVQSITFHDDDNVDGVVMVIPIFL